MTTNSGKKKSSEPGTLIASEAKPRKFQPNRNTIAMRPYNHKEMTKSEMYADLKKAVENTSSPRRSRTGDTK